MVGNAIQNDLSKFNERLQQETSKLNTTLQNLKKLLSLCWIVIIMTIIFM